MIQLRARSAFATKCLNWIEDEHHDGIAESNAPQGPWRRQEVPLIRAFLRYREGGSNCRHNSCSSVNAASPETGEAALRTIPGVVPRPPLPVAKTASGRKPRIHER